MSRFHHVSTVSRFPTVLQLLMGDFSLCPTSEKHHVSPVHSHPYMAIGRKKKSTGDKATVVGHSQTPEVMSLGQ